MLKRWFCKHNYKLYTVDRIQVGNWTKIYRFRFICLKCNHEFTITENEFCDVYDVIRRQYDKERVLNNFIVESSTFTLPRCLDFGLHFESAATTLLLEKYKSKGIDLKEIEQWGENRFKQTHFSVDGKWVMKDDTRYFIADKETDGE